MTRTIAALCLVFAFLTTLSGIASARAVNDLENRVGVFELYPIIDAYTAAPQDVEPHPESTTVVYDSTTGVWVYVNQNPWSRFDPHGLFERAMIMQDHALAFSESKRTGRSEKQIYRELTRTKKALGIGVGIGYMAFAVAVAPEMALAVAARLGPRAAGATAAGADVAITTGEMIGGVDGPGAIITPGDAAKPALKTVGKLVEGVDDVVDAGAKTARTISSENPAQLVGEGIPDSGGIFRMGRFDPKTGMTVFDDQGHFGENVKGLSVFEKDEMVFWANDSVSSKLALTEDEMKLVESSLKAAYPDAKIKRIEGIGDAMTNE